MGEGINIFAKYYGEKALSLDDAVSKIVEIGLTEDKTLALNYLDYMMSGIHLKNPFIEKKPFHITEGSEKGGNRNHLMTS